MTRLLQDMHHLWNKKDKQSAMTHLLQDMHHLWNKKDKRSAMTHLLQDMHHLWNKKDKRSAMTRLLQDMDQLWNKNDNRIAMIRLIQDIDQLWNKNDKRSAMTRLLQDMHHLWNKNDKRSAMTRLIQDMDHLWNKNDKRSAMTRLLQDMDHLWNKNDKRSANDKMLDSMVFFVCELWEKREVERRTWRKEGLEDSGSDSDQATVEASLCCSHPMKQRGERLRAWHGYTSTCAATCCQLCYTTNLEKETEQTVKLLLQAAQWQAVYYILLFFLDYVYRIGAQVDIISANKMAISFYLKLG